MADLKEQGEPEGLPLLLCFVSGNFEKSLAKVHIL